MKLPVLMLIVPVLWLLAGGAHLQAQMAAPAIRRNEAVVDFPRTVTFRLEVEADTEVAAASLAYRVGRLSCLEAAAQVPVEVDGSTLEWTWVMTRSGNPPPGTALWWEWTLTDAAGNTFTTPRRSLTFSDDRFIWRTVTAENIHLHWYEGEDVGPILLEAAVAGLQRLQAEMGIELQDEVRIFIYGSSEDMRQAVLYIQDWAGGVAFSEYNTILIGVPPAIAESWGRSTVRHELAHLVIGQFGRSCVGGSRPTWLDEGLAVYAEGPASDAVLDDIEQAIDNNSFEPLRSLNGAFPAHGPEAGIAYSQSYSVVAFLLDAYGQEKMQALLLTLAAGAGYDEALEQVYGFNVDGLEVAWRHGIGVPPRPILPTPTPVVAANIATVVPAGAPRSRPTPEAAASPAAPGICGVGLIPLVLVGFVAGGKSHKRQARPRVKVTTKHTKDTKFSHRLPVVIILTAVLLLSCNLFDRASQSGPAAAGDVDRDDAIFLLGGQPLTLDPARTHGGPDGPLGHVFSGLVALDANLQVQPELAAGWTVGEDGLLYTFYLRQNAVFHDGRPVTAHDVLFSWERAADPATGSDTAQTYLGDIAGVAARLDGRADHIGGLRALDDHTLEVRLAAPVVTFLEKLAYPVAFVVDRENVGQPDWEHSPNGSGPFRLQRWDDDEIIVLERHDAYYLEPAAVRHVVYDLGPGLSLARYERDEIDLVGIGGSALERARDPNSPFYDELRTGVSMCTSTIGLNTRLAPFDDVRVRQAFNYALDKALLIQSFSQGNALVATGPLPPGTPGYTGGSAGYPFDAQRARRLLAEAGYDVPADLPPLTYTTSGYGDAGGYVTAVITMWQDNLGVTVQPVVIEPYAFLDELYSGNVGHIYDSGWCADYPDPQNFLDVLYHSQSRQNIGGYSNAAVDALLEQARVERDVTTRLALYADIEQMIVAEAPDVFVSHGLTAVLVKPWLEGYTLTPIGVRQWHRVSVTR